MIRLLNFVLVLMTFGMVNIATVDYSNDVNQSIDKLNGLSLNDVFSNSIYTFIETEKTATYSSTFFINEETYSGDIIYFKHNISITAGTGLTTLYLQGMQGYTPQYIYTTSLNHSRLITTSANHTGMALFYGHTLINVSYVSNIVYINLSNLGISQTVSEMDAWYDLWVSLKDLEPHERIDTTLNDLDITDLFIMISMISFEFALVYLIKKGVKS